MITSVVIIRQLCGRGKTGNIRTHKQVIGPVPFIDTDVTRTLCHRGESTTVIVYRDRATEIIILYEPIFNRPGNTVCRIARAAKYTYSSPIPIGINRC